MMSRILVMALLLIPVGAQTKQIDLQPGSGWVDTGMDFKAGDGVRIDAKGELQYTDARQASGPEGLARGYMDLLRNFPLNEAGRGALIGRFGTSEAARPFVVGRTFSGEAHVAGRLYLSINQTSFDTAVGDYQVSVERMPNHARPAKAMAVPAFTENMLDQIPLRVSDLDGNPGDRVNFILVGSQEQVQAALKAAGWITVDRTKEDAVVRGLIATLSKDAYVTLPMSELYLFGRAQDFGYAQADPLRVVASRHHFRLWKAPFELDGQTVWAGAGTHDIGFARDERNNKVTHKIDPNTDGERDYIREGLMQTGMAIKTEYITPKDPVTVARTATGEEYTSDGRTLVVYLAPEASKAAKQ